MDTRAAKSSAAAVVVSNTDGKGQPNDAKKIEKVCLKIKVLGNPKHPSSANTAAITELLPLKAPVTINVNGKFVSFQITNNSHAEIAQSVNTVIFGDYPAVVTLIEENPTVGRWKTMNEGLRLILTITDKPNTNLEKAANPHDVVIVHDCKSLEASDNLLRKVYGALRKQEVMLTQAPVSPAAAAEIVEVDGHVTTVYPVKF